MYQSSHFLQSQTTQRNLITSLGLLSQKKSISAHLGRDLAKLILQGA